MWHDLGGNEHDIDTGMSRIIVPINQEYLDGLDDAEVVNHIRENIAHYEYKFKIDVPVVVRDELAIAVECKAYAKNAMLKRILFDGCFIRKINPHADIVLFQLESQ